MKRKLWAFSITLVLMLLILFGPRHPGGDLRFNPSLGFYRSGQTTLMAARREATATMTGQRYKLGRWTGNCGEEVMFEDQLNCALYLLNHPGLWLGR